MDIGTVLAVLTAFGVGGIMTNYVKDVSTRRERRVAVLEAQRELSGVPDDAFQEFDDAIHELRRQAMLAGSPQGLLRHYMAMASMELGSRQRYDAGELDAVSTGALFDAVEVADMYFRAEQWFNFSIWHPWLARFIWPFQRRTSSRELKRAYARHAQWQMSDDGRAATAARHEAFAVEEETDGEE